MTWINTKGPLSMKDLRGKFVLLDFWTYCCINCMHILPELKKLEKAYPNELVVIGVHTAKFQTEQDSKNITEAVLRYEIEHPVVNDFEYEIWSTYGVSSWPTVLMIDPEGKAVWGRSGEFEAAQVDDILKRALPYYRKHGLLDESPVRFDLAASSQKDTPLRFPGKILADEKGNRLFVADSNHNRIVIASLDGKLIDTIGNGAIGAKDGSWAEAQFNKPQGMYLHEQTLYVADTENHLLRKVDLEKRTVQTIAGTGVQGRNAWPGTEDLKAFDKPPERFVGPPATTAINSPWDVLVHGKDLYIAMAGPHQIWKMPLDESEIGPYAGNGREDIVDGPLLPPFPYDAGFASFAQPSGLTTDGNRLFVADSEGSSIRSVPFDPQEEVTTIVGTAYLPQGRLFTFGDKDGTGEEVLLQHALGVVYHDGNVYIADTYNNKVKVLDPEKAVVKTIAGTGEPGRDDAAGTFDEPAGITYGAGKLYVADTNNHLIRTVDLANNQVSTLQIAGLAPPNPPPAPRKLVVRDPRKFSLPEAVVKPTEGKIELAVKLQLPPGWKINDLAPVSYQIEATTPEGPVDRAVLGQVVDLPKPTGEFAIPVAISGVGEQTLQISVVYYTCQEGGQGICKMESAVWFLPLKVAETAIVSSVPLELKAE